MLKQSDTAVATKVNRNSPLTPGPLNSDAVFAADDLSWRRESPFRPVDWRWRLAQRSLVMKMPRRAELRDPWVRRIKDHLSSLQRAPKSRFSRRASYDHLLTEAAAIRFAADPLIGSELEAWILTGEPQAAVAELSGFEAPVIEAYEACFFDVRPKLDAQSCIVHNVIGPGFYEGFRLDNLAPIWKLIAYFRGRYMLAVVLQAFPGSRVRPWPDWYEASPEEQVRLIKACRRAVLMRCLPRIVSSSRDFRQILEVRAALEAEREEPYWPLGAEAPLLSSDAILPVVDMAETDESAPNLTQSLTVTSMSIAKLTA